MRFIAYTHHLQYSAPVADTGESLNFRNRMHASTPTQLSAQEQINTLDRVDPQPNAIAKHSATQVLLKQVSQLWHVAAINSSWSLHSVTSKYGSFNLSSSPPPQTQYIDMQR